MGRFQAKEAVALTMLKPVGFNMKTSWFAGFVIAVLASFPFQRASADVTPIGSSLTLHAEADAGSGLVPDDQSASQTTALNGLSASVLAQAINGDLSATAESDATASWTSASAGQVSIHTLFTTDNLSAYEDSRVATGSPG